MSLVHFAGHLERNQAAGYLPTWEPTTQYSLWVPLPAPSCEGLTKKQKLNGPAHVKKHAILELAMGIPKWVCVCACTHTCVYVNGITMINFRFSYIQPYSIHNSWILYKKKTMILREPLGSELAGGTILHI